jgi:predicted nuclease of predicted toxin-antitoxin system
LKILLDSCVWGHAVAALEDLGHDVIWAGSWKKDPGDDEILVRAYKEGRILVTLDKDFGELAVVFRKPHRGIIRLVDIPAAQQALTCHQILKRYGPILKSGGIVTVDSRRIRLREPES